MFWSLLNQIRLRQARNNSQIGSSPALITPHLPLVGNKYCLLINALIVLIFSLGISGQALADAARGATLFGPGAGNHNCASCHGASATTFNIKNASNTPAIITYAINNAFGGGQMSIVVNATDKADIAEFIGTLTQGSANNSTAYTHPTPFAYNSAASFSVADLRVTPDPAYTTDVQPFNSVAVTSQGSKGTASFTASSTTVTYTPAVGKCGADSFQYRASGPAGSSDARTVNVTITCPATPTANATNLPNVAYNSSGVAMTLSTTGVVSTLSVPTTSANGGTITYSGTGTSVTYRPATNFYGADSFTYTATGPSGVASGSATVSFTVDFPPTPVAVSNSPGTAFPVGFNSAGTIVVPATTGVVTKLGLATGTTATSNGNISYSGSGTNVTYIPNSNFNGSDSFSYTAIGPSGISSASATFYVNVSNPLPPTAVTNGSPFMVAYNSSGAVITPGTTGFVASIGVPTATTQGGTLTYTSGATVTYIPPTGFFGADSFSFTASNPGGTSASATANILVATPTAPTVVPKPGVVVTYDTATPIDLAGSITSAAPIAVVTVVGGPATAHGTTSVSGKVVTYTPNAGYIGVDSFSYTATSAGGVSGSALVSVVVSPPSVPTVADKNGVSVPFDTPTSIDLTTSITSAAPITIVTVVGGPNTQHGTTSVSGKVVTYTPATGYSGTDQFNYTATNAGGPSTQATVHIIVSTSPPFIKQSAELKVPLNTSQALDLSPFIGGSSISGIRIIESPGHGAVAVTGGTTTITYTPNNNYFGADRITYEAYGNAGTSPIGVINILVEGRPDPTRDANTAAMMAIQMQAAQQFSRAQISNFEQRFDNLHRMAAGNTYGSSGQATGIALRPATTLENIEAQSAQLRTQDTKASQAAAINVGTSNFVTSNSTAGNSIQQPVLAYQPSTQSFSDADAGLAGLLNGPVGSNLLAALTSNAVNLAALNSALNGGNAAAPDAIQVWVAGNLKFGSINNGANTGFSNFRTDGVTIGADKLVMNNLVLGVGLGYAFSKAKMVDDNSKAESNGMSVALYGSYQPLPKTFIDGLVGYGVNKFETDRYVASVDDFAKGSRRGDQVFASVAASYEFREGGMMLSPYGRFDVSLNRLKEATEKGAGQNALHYDDQTSTYTQLSAGLRAEVTHQANFGLIIPRAKIEFQERMLDGGDATLQYADQLGTDYRLSGTKDQSSALVLGVGSNLILKNGMRIALDYQTLRSAGYETSQSVSLRVTKEFGVANSQIPMVEISQLTMPKFGVRVDMGYTFDDNINRTKIASEKETDRIFSINLTKSNNIQIRQNTRLVVSGFLGAERAYYFNGLDRVTGGGQAELQYRTSGDFLAPTFGVFGRAATEQFNSELRDGYRYTAGFTVRKPLTDRINTFAAVSHIQKNAKDVVFDTKEISLRGNLDYTLSTSSTLYLTGEYRHGDILSTGAPSLENLDGSSARARDDVFVRQNFVTYRFEGDTVLATLGYNLSLGPTDGLDFSWRRVESTPSSVPDYVAHKKSYVDNQYSIVYLVRF